MLEVKNISKRFGGTQALNDVSMSVIKGEVVALLGENGAGKSTLIKILAGVFTPDTGSIHYNNHDSTHQVRQMPVAFIHQDLGLIEWMTVAENISMTLGFPKKFGLISWSGAIRRASEALRRLGADINPEVRVSSLNRTEKSLVAIARALAAEAEILVLDEPTASLPADEVLRLFAAVRRLRELGVGMIYVSHRLDEVFAIADRMVVLRDGKKVGERVVAETSHEQTILMIVGREPSQVFRRPTEREGAPLLRITDLSVGTVGPINLNVHSGEILGLVGLRGAGHEVIGRALFGAERPSSGKISLAGKDCQPASPADAMAQGINLVCADRVRESLASGRTVLENFFINPVAAGKQATSLTSPAVERAEAIALGTKVGLRPNNPALPIEHLSGGNQQKVVVGRWLNLHAKLYIFEDPTAGVDVGAKAEIYRLFDVALSEGAAIIIISTDFEEIAKVCHRALVFSRGQIVDEVGSAELSVENLLASASMNATGNTPTQTTQSGASKHAVA